MGGGRDKSGVAIYRRRNGVYERLDGRPIKHRNRNNEKPATLKNFDGNVEWAKSWYDERSEREKRFIDEGIAAIKEYIQKAEFRIRVSETAMQGILNSGEIWNQLQVGTSNGAYDPERRRDISDLMFRHDGDLEDADYEKYGYLSDGTTDAADWYGDFDIVLKKDRMMDRTTITYGDSLDFDAICPSFVSNPQFISSGDRMHGDAYDFMQRAKNLRDTGKFYDRGDGYAELQYHGKVTLNDIEYISLPKSWENGVPSRFANIVERLLDEGFKIKFNNHEND